MELTIMAQWLNSTFEIFDFTILSFWHMLMEQAGFFLTPFMCLVSLTGNAGTLSILLGLVLLCNARTRRIGAGILVAILCGALLTNIFIKEWVARPRPYQMSELYHSWWLSVKGPVMSEYSFPSGHMTSSTAAMIQLIKCKKKRYFVAGCFYVLFMGMSRNYLMVHYPSDVIGGLCIGTIASLLSFVLCAMIVKVCKGVKASQQP